MEAQKGSVEWLINRLPMAHARSAEFRAKTLLFSPEMDPEPRNIRIITSGLVLRMIENVQAGDSIEKCVMGIDSRGDVLALGNFLALDHEGEESYRTLSGVSLVTIDGDRVRDAIDKDPEIQSVLIKKMVEIHRRDTRRMVFMKTNHNGEHSVAKKIGFLLLEMAQRLGHSFTENVISLEADLPRAVIAEIVGVARETISRATGPLDKFLYWDHDQVLIRDVAGLKRFLYGQYWNAS